MSDILDSTQTTDPFRLNDKKLFSEDDQYGINKFIKDSINKDLDNLYPETINQNPINPYSQSFQLNNPVNPNHSVTLRLFPTRQQNFFAPSHGGSKVVLPLFKVKNYQYVLSDDFDPEFWKKFYPPDEKFFLYEDGDNLQEAKLKTRNNENPNIIETYEGQVNEKGERQGLGKLTSGNKIRIGHWEKGQFNGWGRDIEENGDIYEGKFVNGKLYGKGIFSNGKDFYLGEFRNKKLLGFGEIFNDEFHYYGQVWNEQPNGKGKINIYKEGTYEGDFENGEIDGYGVFQFNNGNYYVGEMKRGKMHGYGKLVRRNGTIDNGYFRDDNFIKSIPERTG